MGCMLHRHNVIAADAGTSQSCDNMDSTAGISGEECAFPSLKDCKAS